MTANSTADARQANRLAVIRRLYLYGVIVASLWVMLASFDDLTQVLLDALFGGSGLSLGRSDYLRNAIARNIGTLLVATPLFVVHWYFVRRLLANKVERFSAVRKLALYGLILYALVWASVHLYQWLYQASALLLGEDPAGLNISSLPGEWLYHLLLLIMSAGLGWFLLEQLRGDGDVGWEQGRAGTVRRLFQAIVGLGGFGLAFFGGATLLQVLLRLLLGQFGSSILSVGHIAWAEMAAGGLASLLVGLLVWRINWQFWEKLIDLQPTEASTALRRFYLYAATLISAAVTVSPAAILLGQILLNLLGYPSGQPLDSLAMPLSLIALGLVAWRWHWGQVQAEAARYGDSPESANVRRLYYYLVAAIGLVALWVGLVDLLRLVLDWLFVGGWNLDQYRAGQAANGLSLLAVGAPVWVIHWRTVQRAAEGEETTAKAERHSGPRRAYLYGVALVGALLILFDLGSVLYRLILGLLGDWSGGVPIFDALARSGTGGVFWVLHLLAIRTDSRLADDEAETELAQSERRAVLEERIAKMEGDLAAARAELARLESA